MNEWFNESLKLNFQIYKIGIKTVLEGISFTNVFVSILEAKEALFLHPTYTIPYHLMCFQH